MKNVIKAKEELKSSLKDITGIRGIGIGRNGTDAPFVLINVDEAISSSEKKKIPAEFNDIKVVIQTLKSIAFQNQK